MNEDVKRRGRPTKSHLHEDHHFKASDDDAVASVSPAAVESDQADASEVAPAMHSTSAEYLKGFGDNAHAGIIDGELVEAIVGNSMLPMDAISVESPIEEKIHQLVESASLNGWRPIHTEIVLQMPPLNGMPVRLSETSDGDGILAIWKKTRKFANATHRWEESGKWIHFESGMDISFQPKYWKERYVS